MDAITHVGRSHDKLHPVDRKRHRNGPAHLRLFETRMPRFCARLYGLGRRRFPSVLTSTVQSMGHTVLLSGYDGSLGDRRGFPA